MQKSTMYFIAVTAMLIGGVVGFNYYSSNSSTTPTNNVDVTTAVQPTTTSSEYIGTAKPAVQSEDITTLPVSTGEVVESDAGSVK